MTAAQAPVPHACVSPFPRSHTRIFSVFELTTLTNSVLTLSGKIGAVSNCGPTLSMLILSTLSTNTTQCGLPTAQQVILYSFPPISAG